MFRVYIISLVFFLQLVSTAVKGLRLFVCVFMFIKMLVVLKGQMNKLSVQGKQRQNFQFHKASDKLPFIVSTICHRLYKE